MEKKFFDKNQCVYCGKYETDDTTDTEGWFRVDDDGDKVCDECWKKLSEELSEE